VTACLEVEGLTVTLAAGDGRWPVLTDVSLALAAGESLGVVGESGAGKTTLALALMRLLPPAGRVESGSIRLDGRDLLHLDEAAMRSVRGRGIGLVLQEPGAALDPLFTVGHQVSEALRTSEKLSRKDARQRSLELLRQVAFPRTRLDAYPFELSGGEQQRVMIALALAGHPRLLLCDEPTSALDVTVQAEIIALVKRLRRELALAVLWIAHDFGVIAQTCERVVVIYAGRVVEEAMAEELFAAPRHPYTQGLLEVARQPAPPGDAPERALSVLPGRPVAAGERFPGCAFEPRCRHAMPVCKSAVPPLYRVAPAHRSRCYLSAPVAEGT